MKYLIILVVVLATGCGDKSPTAPTPPPVATPAPTPTPTPTPPPVARVTVAGVVTDADTNRPVGGATVTITGVSTTTDGNGYYSISGIAAGNATMTVTAAGYNNSTEGITVQNVDTRIDRRIAPLWTRSGVGDQVFDMPTFVQRVRVQAVPGTSCQNFIVRIGGRPSIINVILGTCSVADARTLDSTYLTGGGGTVSITSSTGVAWTFTQIQ